MYVNEMMINFEIFGRTLFLRCGSSIQVNNFHLIYFIIFSFLIIVYSTVFMGVECHRFLWLTAKIHFHNFYDFKS